VILWSGFFSLLFFSIASKLGVLRISAQDEILGGDIYYFRPREFQGSIDDNEINNK